ncbi:MAG: insulysin [Candidatus Endobugula sp.]|jgi:insulysin
MLSVSLVVIRFFFFILTCLYFSSSHATMVDIGKVNKGQIDTREYQYLVLDNQLKVLLISDVDADKAAASLDVHVGSSDDPKDREGLAHFLEHMLFLGTEKYPDAADYQAFVNKNAGSHNAYTSAQHTNYFFDIDAKKLASALDRFSQFFIAPLFDATYVDRERNAVHSEYQAKIKDDSRRGYDVYRQLINPHHPYSKFSVGSLVTLANRPNDSVRDDLLAFYDKHYSSDQMTLVVLGKEPIADLKAMVVKRFAQIPQRKVDTSVLRVPLFEDDTLPFEVVIKPVKNIRQMSMTFPLPSVKPYYGEKPLSYLGHLLGHEGKGSVLSLLKQQGWAEGLSAGGGESGAGNATFSITVSLTENGVKHRETIRALIFHALDTVNKDGVEQWRYAEKQQLAKVAFQFREKGPSISAVRNLADQLHDFPAGEVISGAYLYKRFDAELIKSVLAKMTPDNLYVSTVYPEAVTDKVTHHYQVPYAVNALTRTVAKLPTDLKKRYQLPQKNIFIPEQSHLFAVDTHLSEPKKIRLGKNKSVLWIKQNVEFTVPKATISLRVQSPLVSSSLRAAASNQLLTSMIKDALNEKTYPASLAGLGYSLRPNSRGFDISLQGYDNKMGKLLAMVVNQVQTPSLNEERFNSIKTELVRQLNNSQKKTPYRQLLSQVPVTLYAPYFGDEALATALEKISFAELKQFALEWRKGSTLQGLFYGNINTSIAADWQSLITNLLSEGSEAVIPATVLKLAAGDATNVKPSKRIKQTSLRVDHSDSAVALYVQGVADGIDDQAKMLLLRQVLESSFYSQLRTEQQLGYIVFLTSMSLKEVPGSLFVVQSPSTSVDAIKLAITQFILESKASIPDDLSLYQRSVATQLLEKPQTLAASSSRYWQNIIKRDDSFSYRQRLLDAVNKVDAAQLREYYQRTLLNEQRSLWFVADKQVVDHAPIFSEPQTYYQYP